METVCNLLRELIWPTTLIIIMLIFKNDVKNFLSKLTNRIGSPPNRRILNRRAMQSQNSIISTNNRPNNKINYIAFTDIIYNVAIAITLIYFLQAINPFKPAAIICLLFSYVLICDVWWGAHFSHAAHPFDQKSFLIEIFEILNYALMAYFAYKQNIYFLLCMIAYGLIGVIWDTIWLSKKTKGTSEYGVNRLWLIWAITLTGIYYYYFITLLHLKISELSVSLSLIAIGLWIALRVALGIFTRRISTDIL